MPSTISVPSFGSVPTAKIAGARADAMRAILDSVVADGAPDVIAAIITPAGSWAGAAGVGGPDGRAATVKDEFALGSVTKTITTSLVMKLAEQGRIDLDAPLQGYLGDLKVNANGATVRQMLGQRSGLADWVDPAALIGADPAHHWTKAELIAQIPPPASEPGGPYTPAGPNYFLLGLAIEHVTGRSLSDALRTEVLDPVGATRIVQQGAGVPTPKPWALPTAGYTGAFKISDLGAGGAISCISSASFAPGAGTIASDAPSLANWAWHLFAGDVVKSGTLNAMLPADDGHGLGIDVLGAPLSRAIGLTGGKTGYGTVLAVDPATRTIAVVLVNDENFHIDEYIAKLMDAANAT